MIQKPTHITCISGMNIILLRTPHIPDLKIITTYLSPNVMIYFTGECKSWGEGQQGYSPRPLPFPPSPPPFGNFRSYYMLKR